LPFHDDDERLRINVFDWNAEFPHIFPSTSKGRGEGVGGFDAVIGNPPYGFHQVNSDFIKPYFKKHLKSADGSFEHYFLFYEKSLTLLKSNGFHGFIVPVTWLTIPSAQALRKFILDNFCIQEICWLPELVFANAQVNTLISIIKNAPATKVKVSIYDCLGFRNSPKEVRLYDQRHFVEESYFIGIFEKESDRDILGKIINCSQPLGKIARPCSGYNPYEVGKGLSPNGGAQKQETVKTKPYHSTNKFSDEWKPEIVGRDLHRYFLDITGNRWVKYGQWLAAPRDPNNFIGKRILVQEITGGREKRIVACYYDKELYYSRDVIPIKTDNEYPDSFYLLGIINSRLITWYHHKRNPKAQKGLFPKVLVSDLKSIPIHPINFSDSTDKARHDRMVSLVNQMLEMNRKLAVTKLAHEKTALERQIAATDKQIDVLVYELYGLTEEEIHIVESS
jgi:hypothetical protein